MNDLDRIAIVALTVGFTARLLKDGAPSLPRKALPWITLGLSVVIYVTASVSKAMTAGVPYTLVDAVFAVVNGLMSGSLAVAGHETLRPVVEARFGTQIADFVFGKKGVKVSEKETPPAG